MMDGDGGDDDRSDSNHGESGSGGITTTGNGHHNREVTQSLAKDDHSTSSKYTFEYLSHPSQLKELTILMNSLLEMRYSPYVYDYIIKTDCSKFSFLVRDERGEIVAGMGCRLERATSQVLPRARPQVHNSSSISHANAEEKSLTTSLTHHSVPQSLDLCCMMLGVLSEHRRKGIATWMIQHAQYNASLFRGTDGEFISNFYLHVQTSNLQGKAFYESIGFQMVQTIENYYKRLEPASCFVLTLVIHDHESYVKQQKTFLKQSEVI